MSRMFFAKIDVSKINKEKLYKGKKGTYLDLTIFLNDEPDQYGNDMSIQQSLSKEERENGAEKIYLGNGKAYGKNETTQKTQSANTSQADSFQDDNDDMPF